MYGRMLVVYAGACVIAQFPRVSGKYLDINKYFHNTISSVPKDESVFTAQLQELRRIVIPKGICDALGIQKGDIVIVRVRKSS